MWEKENEREAVEDGACEKRKEVDHGTTAVYWGAHLLRKGSMGEQRRTDAFNGAS